MSIKTTSMYQSLVDIRRTVPTTGLRTIPCLTTLSATFLTFPSLLTNASVTRGMGHSLRLAWASLRRTTSPSFRCGCSCSHLLRLWRDAKYSRFHLFQKVLTKCFSCLHCFLWRLDSLKTPGGGKESADLSSEEHSWHQQIRWFWVS